MNFVTRTFAAVALMFAAAAMPARADVLAYPTADDASFLINVPNGWELTQADEEGGYSTLTGPTGVVLSFRTVEATNGAMEAAVQESIQFLQDNYTQLDLDKPEDATLGGLKGFSMVGTGVTEDDQHVVFAMAWYELKSDIGEIWFVADVSDEDGIEAVRRVLKSFRAP